MSSHLVKMSSKSKSKSGRVQPIRATQPFQLLQQSPARRSPCSSPTPPRSSSDPRVAHARHRWSTSPDFSRSSPDRCERKSPNSPSIKVSNRRSPSPSIRRAGSGTFDTIAAPYLIGQWPRETSSMLQNIQISYSQTMRDNKYTQTPDWNSEKLQQQQKLSSKGQPRSTSISGDKSFKEMRQQIRRIAKQSSRHGVDKKERTPGNHTALPQLQTPKSLANPISMAPACFGRTPRRQNSNEALNKEIDILFNNKDFMTAEPRYLQGITPPDGHRAPLPRSSTRSTETQTFQEFTEVVQKGGAGGGSPGSGLPSRTPSPAPSVVAPPPVQQQATSHLQTTAVTNNIEQQHHLAPLQNSSIGNNVTTTTSSQLFSKAARSSVVSAEATPVSKDQGISPGPKYASSPRPNNSYVFKREPPEGAESVKPFKENQDDRMCVFTSCPDKNKVNFYPTNTNSAFIPLKEIIIEKPFRSMKMVGGYDFGGDMTAAALCPAGATMGSNVVATGVVSNGNNNSASLLHSTVNSTTAESS